MNNLSEKKFIGSIDLLKESWKVFSSKAKTLLAIAAIPAGFNLLMDILFFLYPPTSISAWIIGKVLLLLSFFLRILAIPSLVFVLKEDLFLKEAYQKGLKFFLSFLWVYFLVTIIVVGGFLLLIVPGIVFLIWFSLVPIVLIFEEKRGMSALFQSRQLVKGKWWTVFWRLLVFYLIFGSIFLIFYFLLSKIFPDQIVGKISYLFQLFILPFGLIYDFLIYKNLKEIKETPLSEVLPKRIKLKYGIVAFLGLLIIGLIVVFNILNIIFGKDEPPHQDSDLLLSKVEISTKENALYHFLPYYNSVEKEIILKYWPEAKEKLKESKEIYWPTEKAEKINEIIMGKEWDEELVKEILKKNQGFFEDFEKFLQSSYFQDPVVKDPAIFGIDLPLLSFVQYRNFAKLNLLRATYWFKQGKEKEAFDETIRVMKMGKMLEESPLPSMIQYLTGIAIKEMALENLRIMLKETNLSPDLLKTYARELNQFYANREGLVKIFKGEYILFINLKNKVIDKIARGEKISEGEKEILGQEFSPSASDYLIRISYLYKPNQTQRIFAEGFREKIKIAKEGRCSEPWVRLFLPSQRKKLFFTENLMGKILHDLVMVSMSGIFERRCLEDFSVAGTQLLIVLKAYQTENGKLPHSLDELVPEYILELPKDPFDRKTIRYSAEKKIIYSVGPNGLDEGGSEGERLDQMPDPTFKIE